MQQKNLRRAAVAAVLLALVLAALLLFRPTPGIGPKAPGGGIARTGTNAALASADDRAAGTASLVTGPTPEEIPKVTPQCDLILEWHERNVPAWVIEDNIMAQGMKFDEADLACLTAGAVPPQVLDFAEQNVRFPQPAPRKR